MHSGLQGHGWFPVVGSVLAEEQGRSDVLSEVFSFSSCSPRRGGLAREFELRSEHDNIAFSPQEKFPQGSVC